MATLFKIRPGEDAVNGMAVIKPVEGVTPATIAQHQFTPGNAYAQEMPEPSGTQTIATIDNRYLDAPTGWSE